MNQEDQSTEKENPGNQTEEAGHCGTPQEIAQCAYYVWEQEGRPEDRALEHWCRAELQISGTNLAPAAAETTDEKAST